MGQVLSNGCEKHDAKDETPQFLSNNSNNIEEEAVVGVQIRENISQIISPRGRGLEQLLAQKERWINHYSSNQKILLVGEGDFSFSNSLAMVFGSASNMVATSLDSRGFLSTNYMNAISNIQNLQGRGCMVMNGVDATEMATYFWLQGWTFDRVVFNFPHSGFFPNESRNSQLSRHTRLVRLFLENAKKMLRDGGQIHITHKCNGFFLEWNLELLAWECGLRLIEEVPFNFTVYPGYHTKYGFGGDNNFNCNPSKTYKFGFVDTGDLSDYFWKMQRR